MTHFGRHASRVRRSMVMLGAGLLLAACGPATASPATSGTPTAKGFDLSAWTVSRLGTGPTAVEDHGGLDLSIPGNAQEDPAKHEMAVGVAGKCKLSADFDLQLDYSLVTWPPKNGVRLGLYAGTYSVERTSNPFYSDNRYVTDFTGPTTSVATQDTTGKLRLTRVGTLITGYYLSKGTWVMISSAGGSTEPLSYGIGAWTDPQNFGKTDVSITVKDVTGDPPAGSCA